MTRSAGHVARHDNSMSRICVATRRNLARQAFHAALFEAEDVLAATGDVDLIEI